VKDLNGHTLEGFLRVVGSIFKMAATDTREPSRPGECCMYLGGVWHTLEWQPLAGATPEEALDVSILQHRLLTPVLGIEDPRVSDRIDFIGGIRGTAELERLVDSGSHKVAFSMYPTTVQQLMDIADANQIMPPKSTWFEPKLRSGLFIHTLD
jgi:uncharacterized protein (DUF1015 family)